MEGSSISSRFGSRQLRFILKLIIHSSSLSSTGQKAKCCHFDWNHGTCEIESCIACYCRNPPRTVWNLIPTHIGRPSKTRNAAATHSYQWVLLQCNNEQDCKKVVGTDCYQLEDSIAVLKRCKNLRKILTLIFHIVSFLSKNGHAYLPRLQIYVKSKFFVKTKATCTLLKCW